MKQPLFSVIIPTYNRPQMLTRAVESVIAQDWKDWELIVIDDGSDHTPQLPSVTIKNNFQLIRQPNAGPGAARKTGLAVAQGRYICCLDDDDFFFPNHLSTLANALAKEDFPERVFRTSLVPHREDGTNISASPLPYHDYTNSEDPLLQYWKSPCGITSLCFPRSVIERVPIDPKPGIIEDFAWVSRVFLHYPLQQIFSSPTVAYVQHPQNRTLKEANFIRVEERLQVVSDAYAKPGVKDRIPYTIFQRLLQHQLCHAARQSFLAGQSRRGWKYFRRALGYGVVGWRDLLGVVKVGVVG